MASTYYDSQLTAAKIESALDAIDGVIVPSNNGKVLMIENGRIKAESVGEIIADLGSKTIVQNGTYHAYDDSLDGYDEVVVNVPQGEDATAVANDILYGKTAMINGTLVTGEMTNNGAVAGIIDGTHTSYTVPVGYHNGEGTVSADIATTAEVKAYFGIT